MNFIDKTKVFVRAGAGGNGKLSFRQEKFVDKGGPDGGDGGHGGNVIFEASRNQNTLAAFRYQRELLADPGLSGGGNNKHGRSGKHLFVKVPVGTIIMNGETVLADLTADGQTTVIAKGGKGGYGNAHFVSSRRQTPRFAEKGEPGEEFNLQLELKMIADVGLVGMPNAGKSTLLSRLSNARPEIADYAFTTLTPNLGVVDVDGSDSLLFADIPGLIEGAASGKGLGHEFLRHVERTAVIVHLIDAYNDDIVDAYQTIQAELKAYSSSLAAKAQVIAINKVDGLDADIIQDLQEQLQAVAPPKAHVLAISAAAGTNLKELIYDVQKQVQQHRADTAPDPDALPIIRINPADERPWTVLKTDNGFQVRGRKIEQFAARTEFSNEEAMQRLRDIMKKTGIMSVLIKQGIEADQTIYIGDNHHFSY